MHEETVDSVSSHQECLNKAYHESNHQASCRAEGECSDVDEVIITNGSHGSRILSKDCETKIDAVKCEDIKDSTGCGDTYMAAYIAKRLNNSSIKDCGDFASKIASEKLKRFGHY